MNVGFLLFARAGAAYRALSAGGLLLSCRWQGHPLSAGGLALAMRRCDARWSLGPAFDVKFVHDPALICARDARCAHSSCGWYQL